MTNTYSTMQSRIADEVGDSALNSQIKNAIQDAISLYEREEWYFNTSINTFNTVANQEYYSASDLAAIGTLITIKSMVVSIQGVWVEVVLESFENIDAWQTGFMIGVPRSAAYFNEQIRLFYIPDTAYAMKFAAVTRLATLSADTDTNSWMTDAEILIRQCAKRLLRGDVERAGVGQEPRGPIEQEAYDKLRAETRRRMSKISLRSDIPVFARSGYFDMNSGSFF